MNLEVRKIVKNQKRKKRCKLEIINVSRNIYNREKQNNIIDEKGDIEHG